MSKENTGASLDAFFAEGLITEVLYEVRSGKEATVFCCRAAESTGKELMAAKVYRTLEQRGFRDDAVYQAGRSAAFNRRDRLAFEKKTRHGRNVQLRSWIEAEYQTLRMLHAAGADVPEPFFRSDDALLMEFVGDICAAAPMLNRVSLSLEEASPCFRRIVDNIALWLGCNRVHGDLSPFNILYWEGHLQIIDFPQAVDPRVNPNARTLLERDLNNVCRYFARFGARADSTRIAGAIWNRYRFGSA